MPRYFELEVSLRGIKPRIWRRFQLAEDATFLHLHQAIQIAFDWEDYHLFGFYRAQPYREPLAGTPDDGLNEVESPDAANVPLAGTFAGPGASKRCVYVYDFGDDWTHDVKLRNIVDRDEHFHRRLLAGARSGPPEDTGGLCGYARLVEFFETGLDPAGDPESLADWIEGWRPDAFDLDAARQRFDADEPVYPPPDHATAEPVALPPGTDPRLVEVVDLLRQTMAGRGWHHDLIDEARATWVDFVEVANPKPRKPAIYAAAIEYCVALANDADVSQTDVAEAYGTSVASVSQTWRQVWDALDLDVATEGAGGLMDEDNIMTDVPDLVLDMIDESYDELVMMADQEAAETLVQIVRRAVALVRGDVV